MRILYCNKFDYPFSGTEAYLFDLIQQMDKRGQETALFSMDHGRTPAFAGRAYRIPHIDFKNPNAGFLKKIKMAAHALYSVSARRAMRKCLADFSPDLAHVRNLPPLIALDPLGTEEPGDPRALPLERLQDFVSHLQFCCQWESLRTVQSRRFPPRRHEGLLCRPAFERCGSCR
jgi:hypothetical protein